MMAGAAHAAIRVLSLLTRVAKHDSLTNKQNSGNVYGIRLISVSGQDGMCISCC